MSPEPRLQVHILSFEGPDPYAQAGGIASRITGLSEGLAELGNEPHLWFVGDPDLPGHETRRGVLLHRWCQWISRHHPGGVYDGEEGKRADFVASLPPYLLEESLRPHLERGGRALVLAEEWQTADAVLHLDWLLRRAGQRDRVDLFWNANNTFGFDRIDWGRLGQAAVLTTVSRYMRQLMRSHGVDPLVVPNGLARETLEAPPAEAAERFRELFRDRTVLAKVARWDPDKRWVPALQIVAELKRQGLRPLLVARGGMEPYGHQVLAAAAALALRVVERASAAPGADALLEALRAGAGAGVDVIVLGSRLDAEGRRLLFREAAAVLANSVHEPFGLVGLETMAAGGLACTGCSGEDYVVPGRNALALQSPDPREFVALWRDLRAEPGRERRIRRAGRLTAEGYLWPEVIRRDFLPQVGRLGAGVAAA